MTVNTLAAPRQTPISSPARKPAALLGLTLLALSAPTAAATPATPATVETLDQRLKILERQLELAKEEQEAAAKANPKVTVNDRGLNVQSADGAYAIKLRGTFHTDGRFFLNDEQAFSDGFLIRRLFVDLQGQLGSWASFRVMPDFGGSSPTIVDAYFDLKFAPWATLRVGRQKGPVSLDRLQSVSATPFIERGATNELAPNRDVGVTLQGDVLGGALSYQAGIYNGTPDGRDSPSSNDNDNFEYAARLFAQPFKSNPGLFHGVLQGLGLGIAGSTGTKEGAGTDFLPRYRTPGQNTFFSYRSSSTTSTGVVADGDHIRIAPQGWWYYHSVGLFGEWIRSSQELTIDGNAAELEHDGWQLFGSWVLTGEDASYGNVKPATHFKPGGAGWGAVELVLGAGEIDIDDAAFPLFANADSAASKATSYSAGVNWYMSSNVRVALNYMNTAFTGGAAAGADRNDEQAIFTRLQIAF